MYIPVLIVTGLVSLVLGGYVVVETFSPTQHIQGIHSLSDLVDPWPKKLNTELYDKKLLDLAHYVPPVGTTTASTSPLVYGTSTNVTIEGKKWPKAQVYPHGGAILPFHRVIAYYGNFYSTRMGILGEFDRETVLTHLQGTVDAWEQADPETPVMPAIHYIAMVAQGEAGRDGYYRAVMPDEEIEKAYDMSEEINGILFLDLQVGLSTLQEELPKFSSFLKRPTVHLAIDPEFAMHNGAKPGTVIGSFSAEDIQYTIEFLSKIVRDYKLPPKILIVHRFTDKMVGNTERITPTEEVQVVLHMDGWGSKELKRGTYKAVIEPEPIQFAGLKIFYKNDLKPPSTGIFTPTEALELYPKPIYIQYQ